MTSYITIRCDTVHCWIFFYQNCSFDHITCRWTFNFRVQKATIIDYIDLLLRIKNMTCNTSKNVPVFVFFWQVLIFHFEVQGNWSIVIQFKAFWDSESEFSIYVSLSYVKRIFLNSLICKPNSKFNRVLSKFMTAFLAIKSCIADTCISELKYLNRHESFQIQSSFYFYGDYE